MAPHKNNKKIKKQKQKKPWLPRALFPHNTLLWEQGWKGEEEMEST